MDITYLGHSSFKLKGKKTSVVTDPYDSAMTGIKFPKSVEANIVTVSHDHEDHNAITAVSGNPFVVKGPGEYEIAGISIIGVPSFHDSVKGKERGRNTIYCIEVDGIHICHLGDLGEMLNDKDIEALGTVDILLIPVGGTYTITAKQAQELVAEIEPSIVVPMHYGRAELNQKAFGDLTPLETFLKLMGAENVAAQPKLSMTKDKLPETMQIVVLEM